MLWILLFFDAYVKIRATRAIPKIRNFRSWPAEGQLRIMKMLKLTYLHAPDAKLKDGQMGGLK